MKLGIMQPYFFPYLGYWQLMNAVDRYVIYDDVNFIKGGRINRNAILTNGQAHNINLPLLGASPNKHINEVGVNCDPIQQRKLLETLRACYARAPYYREALPVLEKVLTQQEDNLGRYLTFQMRVMADFLGMDTELIVSSELEKDTALKAENKVLHICSLLGATEYYNSVSGIPLYEPHRARFEAAGIELRFPRMRPVTYRQYKNDFVPNLSIIDVMMFCSRQECRALLKEFDFVEAEERRRILAESE
ncbi:MAG: WbqC family protein [Oscillospiraceae bacterium]|nr:WbqC family protein [Oscillospiraceae bacterium]